MLKKFSVTCLFGFFCFSVCFSLGLAEEGQVSGQVEKLLLFSSLGDSCSPCDPCDPIESSCEKQSGKQFGWEFDFGGWLEAGVYTNSHGSRSNGPMHTSGNARRDFHLDQLYFYGDAKYKTQEGFELGGRADLVYGVDAAGMQSGGDDSFDSGWGLNRHGYAAAVYQLFGTVSYKELSVKVGKFITPIGWEGSASKDNFFYSHSYCYWLEPSTHSGVLFDYAVNDRLKLSAGWTAGNDTSFQNRYNDNALLAGVTFNLTDKATIYYWMTVGKAENGFRKGEWRFDNNLLRQDFFIQSLCFEWMPTDRFTYVMQYNLRNDADVERTTYRTSARYSSYGINNHFLYKLDDCWGVGLRLEWLRDNGGFGYFVEESANYFQMTLGLNWNPTENLSIRPEVRYDNVVNGEARPFGNGKPNQLTGGFGIFYSF
jgi:hypothetical protein